MIMHTNPLFTVCFGGIADGISAQQYQEDALTEHSLTAEPFQKLKKQMHVEQLFFLRQVHGIDGIEVTEELLGTFSPFECEGDYLITQLKVGIGVLTADCLPVVIYDSFHNCVAIVHAGWRGSVQDIVIMVLDHMNKRYGTKKEHVRILFGPSAKVCCYQVSLDFVSQLHNTSKFASEVIVQKGEEYFFDLPALNRLQLEDIGIKKEMLCQEYNICTICHDTFNSYRRDGKEAGRQMTVVALR